MRVKRDRTKRVRSRAAASVVETRRVVQLKKEDANRASRPRIYPSSFPTVRAKNGQHKNYTFRMKADRFFASRNPSGKPLNKLPDVIPAKAGIHFSKHKTQDGFPLDQPSAVVERFRGNDDLFRPSLAVDHRQSCPVK